ncbi:uncharacterized protein MONBRDRAFT_7625 [Monosiga brevicollis MX1]|uniref:Cytochrome P450 n=1 Tax=Monosiga brevicollis TaxID=81824 RepID=A9UXU2_MONBE|nr:uncharacterized protein MONBRDRAFT_7625 [Monosiga brevicollis MX1]EDQ89905.1 predicted protein [Monosiga brevicollis MX1]|eukprot:XP_001745327.1 hypothetical protein [Monosiga brevicollis MX1]
MSLVSWVLMTAHGSAWTVRAQIIGQAPYVCVLDPVVVKHVLQDNFDNYIKGRLFRDRFTELLGRGIFNADGPEWSYQRKTAAHLFKRRELSGFMTDFEAPDPHVLVCRPNTTYLTRLNVPWERILRVFSDHGRLVCQKLDEASRTGTVVDLQELFYRYTLESIGKIAFGVNLGCFENDRVEFAVNFDTAQRIIMERVLDPAWEIRRWFNFIHPDEIELRRCVKKLDGIAHGIIQDRRKIGDLSDREDLLSRFMAVKDEQGKPLDDERLRDVVMSFVIAGRDTTANCLSWVFYELHQHPEVFAKLKKEVDTVLDGAEPTHDLVHSGMPYLHAVVKETLRLHPSVPKDGKVAVKDDVLPDGTVIKAGTIVIYLPWVMGRMESLWEDATRFNPERWLNQTTEPSHFQYTAFNAGPRLCLGMHMAYIEAKLLVAMLVQRFDFEVKPNQEFTYTVTLTMPLKNGLLVTPTKRA